MTSAQRTATPSTAGASLPVPIFQPRELAALGELLDALEGAEIRVYLDAAGATLRYQAPRGALTPDLRARIAGHKGALVRALRAAGAIGEAPRVPTAIGSCHEATHLRPPDYSYTLGRWVCVTCEPDVYALFVLAVARAYDARERAQCRGALDASDVGEIIRAAFPPARLDRGPLMRELLAWGEAHDWPPLAYGWRTGASGPHGDDRRPYKSIMAGAAGWRRFVSGNTSAELLAAQRAAAGYPAPVPPDDPTPDPVPSTGTRSTPGAAPAASTIADRAPDGPAAQTTPGASLEEPQAPAVPAIPAVPASDPTLAPTPGPGPGGELRDWPDCFAALDTGGLWLARIGEHSAMGEPDRRDLDVLTQPDTSSASARRLLTYMEREGITQLWIHPTWAAAAGLPMAPLGEREQLRDGIAHAAFADAGEGASWATSDSPAGTWGMDKPGRLRSWLKFWRRGESGTIAIALPHLDGRVPWRNAAGARELLAAILAYRGAMRGLAYRSGPGPTSTALLRVVHRGSSAALDLTASATPADFPPPARQPGLTPQWSWIRERTAAECERGRYVIGLDKNGMFLAATSSLRVGLDAAPVHLTFADGDPLADGPSGADEALAAAVKALTDMHSRPRPKRPVGYWLARVAFPPDGGAPIYPHAPLLPHPCYTGPTQPDPAAGWQWYMSATLELAAELGARIEVQEAYLWPRESIHEPLEPWYQRLRDARASLMRDSAQTSAAPGAALALAAVKATYSQGIGWLDGSWLRTSEAPEDLYRPDWRHAAIATANANLWRNLARGLDAYTTGASDAGPHPRCAVSGAPLAIVTDAAYYVTATPDPLALAAELGLRMGTGLGHYKVKLAPFPLDSAELAPVWELMAAGRDMGRVASAFASAVHESEG